MFLVALYCLSVDKGPVPLDRIAICECKEFTNLPNRSWFNQFAPKSYIISSYHTLHVRRRSQTFRCSNWCGGEIWLRETFGFPKSLRTNGIRNSFALQSLFIHYALAMHSLCIGSTFTIQTLSLTVLLVVRLTSDLPAVHKWSVSSFRMFAKSL